MLCLLSDWIEILRLDTFDMLLYVKAEIGIFITSSRNRIEKMNKHFLRKVSVANNILNKVELCIVYR